jgi:hypothetical protein
MQSPNEPAERDLVVENLQAVPGFSRGGHVKDKLEQEHNERRAAKYVGPACALPRDLVLQCLPNRCGKLHSRFEPGAQLLDQPHDDVPDEMLIRRAVGAPGVGISPAWINRLPCSTL